MTRSIRRVPLVGPALANAVRLARQAAFRGSQEYWACRHGIGDRTGARSRGVAARFRAKVVRGLMPRHGIGSLIE